MCSCADLCIDIRANICTNKHPCVCVGIFAGIPASEPGLNISCTCVDMRSDMRADMCVAMCVDLFADMSVDMCVDMCVAMCVDAYRNIH